MEPDKVKALLSVLAVMIRQSGGSVLLDDPLVREEYERRSGAEFSVTRALGKIRISIDK